MSRWWQDPHARFGLLSLGLILLAGIASLIATLIAGLPWWVILGVIVLTINLLTLIFYRYDKAVASSSRTRVPEWIRLALALFGGSPAAYFAIYKFKKRHKARKVPFMVAYWLIVAAQVVAICAVIARLLGWL